MSFLLKDHSRKGNWTSAGKPTVEQINCGSLMRIADGIEAMATYHMKLIESRDTWERIARERYSTIERFKKSNAALRGHLKRKCHATQDMSIMTAKRKSHEIIVRVSSSKPISEREAVEAANWLFAKSSRQFWRSGPDLNAQVKLVSFKCPATQENE